ncbi:MAG: radical SAM protein [Candidatus Omnitrophica bacterium]|nr:radical SAM protein [Candidatus Omnitrophota bacterium]
MKKEIKSRKFWKNFSEKTAEREIPFKLSFELTHNCNLSCRHCYIAAENKKELFLQEICSILEQLADAGCFHINFTGGEIFIRSDILDILEFAKNKGFYIVLLTNAVLITPEIARRLKKIGINQVDISFYGTTKETYESITNVGGSFERCLKGINLLKENGIYVCLKAMAMNLNRNEISRVKEFAKNINVRFQYGYLLHSKIDGSKQPLCYRLPPEEIMELTEEMCVPRLHQSTVKVLDRDFKKEFFYCSAGRNSFAITPYGEMNLCLQYRFPKYDLRKGSVASGWRELTDYVKSALPSENYECDKCEFRQYCNWCPADGLLECGDRNACVPYLKEIARLRKEKRIEV